MLYLMILDVGLFKKQHIYEMNVIEIKNIKLKKWKYKKRQDFKRGESFKDKGGLLLINRWGKIA